MILVWKYRTQYNQTREVYFSGWVGSPNPHHVNQPYTPWTHAAVDVKKNLEITKKTFLGYMLSAGPQVGMMGKLELKKKKDVLKKGKKG